MGVVMSEDKSKKEVVQLRKLTEKHLKNLRICQVNDNCDKVKTKFKKVKCNICGYESDLEFLHWKSSVRPNERCPNCYSFRRTRLLWYYLENYTDILIKDDFRVLHTSAESSIYKRLKKDFGDRYISSDIVESTFVDEIIDIQNIPYEDNTFDLIISSHVLEHVPNDKKALKEFYRVLKPNGQAVILVPSLYSLKKTFELPQINTPELRQRYYKQHDHQRYYSCDDFFNLLESVGFKVNRTFRHPNKNDQDIREQYALALDPLFIATKILNNENSNIIGTDKKAKDYCNICDTNVKFKTHDSGTKICPKCSSTSEERLLYDESKIYLKNNSSLLYINPENALEKKLIETVNYKHILPENIVNEGKIHSLINKFSKNEDNIDVSDNDLVLQQLKNTKSSSYDVILTSHLLDNSVNDEEVLNQLKRILKNNGKLFLKENIDLDLSEKIELDFIDKAKLRKMFYGNANALRCYAKDFIDKLENYGFTVEYENPEEQYNNVQLKSELIKDYLLICTKND